MKRWIRFVLPIGAVLAGMTATVVVHSIEQADPSDPSFLSPVSHQPDGAADLAARLEQRGVTVDRRTRTPEAIAAVTSAPGSTLFVPAPQMVHPDYRHDLRIVPPSVRVVLVAPTADVLGDVGLPTPVAGPRWTAAAPHSGCSEQFAARPAAVLRLRYGADDSVFSCYEGGVVEVERGGPSITLVGAADPFRNDRQDEWNNAGLAAGLLSRGERVVWLDLHEREQPPPRDPLPGAEDPGYDPDEQTGEGDSGSGDEAGEDEDGGDGTEGRPQSGGSGEQEDENPLAAAFPPAFWATVLLLLLALLALAAASARRLGAPVPEPLPTRVRAAETVRGLGGLYRRARARDASLSTVQAAAVHRLAVHLGLPPDSDADTVARQVANHLNASPEEVRDVLAGPAGDTDEDLAEKAAAVQRLVRHVIGERNEGDAQ